MADLFGTYNGVLKAHPSNRKSAAKVRKKKIIKFIIEARLQPSLSDYYIIYINDYWLAVPRLGLLAAASGDGILRIYSVPDPEHLQKELGILF